MASIDARAEELLTQTLLGQLGYLGLDGYPHVLPIWFEYRDGDILIASQPNTYKGRSLSRNPRASVAVSTEWPYRLTTVVGDATVEPLPEPERIRLIDSICHRYLGQEGGDRYFKKWYGDGPGDGELIRVHPVKVRFYDVSGEG